jgi:hypothetical protein
MKNKNSLAIKTKSLESTTAERDELKKRLNNDTETNAKRSKTAQDLIGNLEKKNEDFKNEIAKQKTRLAKMDLANQRQIKSLEDDKKAKNDKLDAMTKDLNQQAKEITQLRIEAT